MPFPMVSSPMSMFSEMYRAQSFSKMLPVPSSDRLNLLEYGGKGIAAAATLLLLTKPVQS